MKRKKYLKKIIRKKLEMLIAEMSRQGNLAYQNDAFRDTCSGLITDVKELVEKRDDRRRKKEEGGKDRPQGAGLNT